MVKGSGIRRRLFFRPGAAAINMRDVPAVFAMQDVRKVVAGRAFTKANKDEVLNDPQVKLVVVCTHADSHFEYAKRALEAGKNVQICATCQRSLRCRT
jgi:predicted dehydrogenase